MQRQAIVMFRSLARMLQHERQSWKIQAAEGYRLIDKDNKASFGLTALGYFFEKDIENTGTVEYKLYADDAVDSSESVYGVENRIQDQGKLGWFFATSLGRAYSNAPSQYDLTKGVVSLN